MGAGTKYFTQGRDKLLVVTDHKPIVKILGDRTLDEISNTRLFRIKQRTLPWRFEIENLPGVTNLAADATSRHPAPAYPGTAPALDDPLADIEPAIMASVKIEASSETSLTWDRLVHATASDNQLSALRSTIEMGFTTHDWNANDTTAQFWKYREALSTQHTKECLVCKPELSR